MKLCGGPRSFLLDPLIDCLTNMVPKSESELIQFQKSIEKPCQDFELKLVALELLDPSSSGSDCDLQSKGSDKEYCASSVCIFVCLFILFSVQRIISFILVYYLLTYVLLYVHFNLLTHLYIYFFDYFSIFSNLSLSPTVLTPYLQHIDYSYYQFQPFPRVLHFSYSIFKSTISSISTSNIFLYFISFSFLFSVKKSITLTEVVRDLSSRFSTLRRREILTRARDLLLSDYHNTMLAAGDGMYLHFYCPFLFRHFLSFPSSAIIFCLTWICDAS